LQRAFRAKAAAWGLISPASALLAFFFFAPLAFFLIYSFWQLQNFQIVPAWTVSNYTNAFQAEYTKVMVTTFMIAGITAVSTTTLACVFASVLRFQLRRYQDRILFLVLIALFSGYIVRIFAWRTILGTDGLINTALLDLHIISQPISWMLYTRFSVIVVLTNFLLPLAILPCHGALQNVSDEQMQAARDLGCSGWTAYRRVALPLAWPGIFLAFGITFILTTGDYLTPEVVGSPSGTMIGQNIADIFLVQFDWPQGAALAFVSLAAVLAAVGAMQILGRRVVR
jgi:spermidine/putrescine transport system permease protein